jgi:hypothetical protein
VTNLFTRNVLKNTGAPTAQLQHPSAPWHPHALSSHAPSCSLSDLHSWLPSDPLSSLRGSLAGALSLQFARDAPALQRRETHDQNCTPARRGWRGER